MPVALAEPEAEGLGHARPDGTWPQSPGLHHLKYDTQVAGKQRTMSYGLYLPPEIEAAAEADRKLPMLVFLCGAGSRGHSTQAFYKNGPLAEMRRVPALKKSIDFVVLHPQVPTDYRWESAEMGRFVVELTERVKAHWPIDPDRVHLVGASMGGEGVWHMVEASPKPWATVTAVGGRKHPKPELIAEKMKDRTAWLVVGSDDGQFTSGSAAMARAFDTANVDVIHTVVPGYRHNIWRLFFNKVEFYDWIMLHRRGAGPPPDRPDEKALLAIAKAPPPNPGYQKFARRMQAELQQLARWWHVENCGGHEAMGYHEKFAGRKGVFITSPLSNVMPCRVMITTDIAEKGKTTLKLTVGHPPRQGWRLTVNVDNQPVLKRWIQHGRRANREIWMDLEVDLTPYAGQQIAIEMLHAGRGRRRPHAFWDRIEIVHEPPAEP